MKRILALIFVLLLVLCSCSKPTPSNPSAEEVKKYIPPIANVSIEDYPQLEQVPPSLEECIALVPEEYKTFTYRESEWVRENNGHLPDGLAMLQSDGIEYYIPADGSGDSLLCHYQGSYDYYELLVDPIDETEEYLQYNYVYSYNSDGELDYYSSLESALAFELTGPDAYLICVYGENTDYNYNYEFGELYSISVWPYYINGFPQAWYSFEYYPQHKAFRNITYNYQEEGFGYTAYYTADNQLESVYYSSADMTAEYDGNYQLINSETFNESFWKYLKERFS